MSATNPKVLAASAAIKQSLQVNAGPGSSINMHPNQFFLNVLGEVDTLKAAELVVQRLEAFYEKEITALKAEIERLEAGLAQATQPAIEG